MAYMHDGTALWLDGIGAGDIKEKLLSSMGQLKSAASSDDVMYKDEDTMDEKTEDVTMEDAAIEIEAVDETEVKAEEEVEADIEAEDEVETEAKAEEEVETEAEAEETPAVATEDVSSKAISEVLGVVSKGFEEVAEVVVALREEIAALSAELEELKSTSKAVTAQQEFVIPEFSFSALMSSKSTQEEKSAEDVDNLATELLKDAPIETEAEDEPASDDGFISLF